MAIVSGLVERGKQLARRLGFPTANIRCALTLPEGVYAALTIVAVDMQKSWPSLAYLHSGLLEVHLMGAELQLYDCLICVHLTDFIRAPVTYHSEQQMRQQIEQDMLAVTFADLR